MRTAIVHHGFVASENVDPVVITLADMYPNADIFALITIPDKVPKHLRSRLLQTSFIDRMPFAHNIYRRLLPLYPIAVEQLDLSAYDLVLTSDAGLMKGTIVAPSSTHICYCHDTMPDLWQRHMNYQGEPTELSRVFFSMTAHYLRGWDHLAAQRVTRFVASSRCVAARVRQYYGRGSVVIHPPVDVTMACLEESHNDCYLSVGDLLPDRRVDILIEACNRLGRRLRIVGSGPEEARLRAIAGHTIDFLGKVDGTALWQEYARCRAFLYAAEETVAPALIEAQACGRPVIALGKGAALESVVGIDSATPRFRCTGLFFYEQNVRAIVDSILRFESCEWLFQPGFIREWATRYGTCSFRRSFQQLVESTLQGEPAGHAARVI